MGAQSGDKGWYELPFRRLLKYVAQFLAVGIIVGWIGTRILNIDLLILQFHLANLWLLAPETAIVMGSLWIWTWSRSSEKKKRKKQHEQDLKTIAEHMSGGEEKK